MVKANDFSVLLSSVLISSSLHHALRTRAATTCAAQERSINKSPKLRPLNYLRIKGFSDLFEQLLIFCAVFQS